MIFPERRTFLEARYLFDSKITQLHHLYELDFNYNGRKNKSFYVCLHILYFVV